MWIMVTGPYTTGARNAADRERNLASLNRAALEVFRRGHVPVIGVNMALPVIEVAGAESYEEIMMPLSLALAERCDAILRIEGPSAGADDEVRRVLERGGTLYRSIHDIPSAPALDSR